MTENPIVCCVKWGTKYPAIYANRLLNMVRRNLARPHDFVCLTDDPAGLDPAIRPIRLPDADFTGFWTKISLFRPDLFEAGRTVVYLDVDVVIVGLLDFILEDPGGMKITKGFSPNSGFNSSVMRFQSGEQVHIYERFAKDAQAIVASGRYAGDQNWIRACAPDARYFPSGKIVSYKKDMNSHVLLTAKKLGFDPPWLRAPRFMTVAPPAGAAIVVFHGKPDPEDVMDAPYGPWKRAPFVKEHWL